MIAKLLYTNDREYPFKLEKKSQQWTDICGPDFNRHINTVKPELRCQLWDKKGVLLRPVNS
jgi:hypothetical protein